MWQWIGYKYLIKITHAQIMPISRRKNYFALENKLGFPKVKVFHSIYHSHRKLFESYQKDISNTLKEIGNKY